VIKIQSAKLNLLQGLTNSDKPSDDEFYEEYISERHRVTRHPMCKEEGIWPYQINAMCHGSPIKSY